MSKSLRLSEKWFNRSLWVVALVFAGFLVSLGSSIIADLPRVEHIAQREDFIDTAAAAPIRAEITRAIAAQAAAQASLEQAQLLVEAARKASANGQESFANWVATRNATKLPSQDDELIGRTRALDQLKAAEAEAQVRLDAQRKIQLDAQQAVAANRSRLSALETAADEKLRATDRATELRVFGYRLAVTLPLLAIAGYLFVRQRRSRWWPFVWGYIFFALFTFFFELVPYLPDYGGYVRSAVGIVITVFVGRYAIVALNDYLARQRLVEAQPNQIRREVLSYDTALVRLSKNVCPGCERPVDLKNPAVDFCPHCGIGLFDHCAACEARKSAFSKFCPSCGTPPVDPLMTVPPVPLAGAPA